MPDQLDAIDQAIREAWTDLQAARQAWTRSANSDTLRHETTCEWRLNRLLERRRAATTAQQGINA